MPEAGHACTSQEKTMDLQIYYKKIREMEQGLSGPSVVVVSLEPVWRRPVAARTTRTLFDAANAEP